MFNILESEMHITGLFTDDEIRSAEALNVIVTETKGGMKTLQFMNDDDCSKWINTQKNMHPERWENLIIIKPKQN